MDNLDFAMKRTLKHFIFGRWNDADSKLEAVDGAAIMVDPAASDIDCMFVQVSSSFLHPPSIGLPSPSSPSTNPGGQYTLDSVVRR